MVSACAELSYVDKKQNERERCYIDPQYDFLKYPVVSYLFSKFVRGSGRAHEVQMPCERCGFGVWLSVKGRQRVLCA